MGANPNSYVPAQVAAVFEVHAERADLSLRLDTECDCMRVRLSVAHARYLAVRLREELDAYDCSSVQSPIRQYATGAR